MSGQSNINNGGISNAGINNGGTNGWAPSSVIIIHDENTQTSMHFNPLEPRRVRDATWKIRMRIYGKNPLAPLWEEESDEIRTGEQFEISSDEIARNLNLTEMLHYAEFHPYSFDVAPVHEQIVTPVYTHYTSRTGAFEAHVPSMYIYGSKRSFKMKSRFRYQNFPCVEIGGPFEPRIFIMNPNLRKANYWVRIVTSKGERYIDEGPFPVRPKSVSHWQGSKLADGLEFQPTGVIIKTDLMLSCFVGTFNRQTQKMAGMDHTHPFFPPA